MRRLFLVLLLGCRHPPAIVPVGHVGDPPPITRPDRDGDGIPDADDKCPSDAEDFDGFEDADGCPDPDNDGDGIPDTRDMCPNTPENRNGVQDEDGCPEETGDRDGDGIPDNVDKCPDTPESANGVEDADGCPER
jgi:OOP family OmpA-OmpF porin